MSISERIFDAITNAIKINDKVDALSARAAAQAQRIEALTERVIRLEATVDLLMQRTTGGHLPGRSRAARLPKR